MTWDAVVVGAGPAGSVTAHRLASEGASVLVLERARFPRDKPCGGGVTVRALRQLPFGIEPVVEHAVDAMEFRLAYRGGYVRRSEGPLILMTQRLKLDAYLAERAAAAGAELREGQRVTDVVETDGGFSVAVGERHERCRLLVGADGVNGVTARRLGLGAAPVYGVALEGNLPYGEADESRYRGTAVIELGTVPGGYGWIFPKGDHVNVGVGGWEREGPALRGHLAALCAAHGIPVACLQGVRGYRLPLRRPEAPLARGRALVVGDAAGLVDPLSGDGMYEAFLSARLAAGAVLDVLGGQAADLTGYDTGLRRSLARLTAASWSAKHAFDRFPRLTFALSRPPFVWPVVEGLLRGDLTHPGAARGLGRSSLRIVKALAALTGSPGARYLVEGA